VPPVYIEKDGTMIGFKSVEHIDELRVFQDVNIKLNRYKYAIE
jgi:hypothetical protein